MVHTHYVSAYLYYFSSTNTTKIDIQKYFKIPFTSKNRVALSAKRGQHSGILKILKNPFMVLQKNINNYAKKLIISMFKYGRTCTAFGSMSAVDFRRM